MLGVIEEETPKPDQDLPAYNDILRKNVHLSQSARLKRRAETRSEEARAETKHQQDIAENAKIVAATEAEKPQLRLKKLQLKQMKQNGQLRKQRYYQSRLKRILKKQ